MNLEKLNEIYLTKKSQRDLLQRKLKKAESKYIRSKKNHEASILARLYLQEVAQKTQNKVEAYISNIVSLALEIFPNPYEFLARFVQRRNKTECDLLFIKEGEEYNPTESSGGGPLDMASLTLRVAFRSFKDNRPFIFLDEPGKHTSPKRYEDVSKLIKKISEKLKLQFIIISHHEGMSYIADKVFHVKGGKLVNAED